MSRMLGTGVPDRLARFLARRYGLLAADLLRLTVERHSDGLTEVTLTLLVADSDLTDPAPAMVNVPVLKYGDRCEAHGYDTYVLDGVTFHRATLGVCTDTSAPPRTWRPMADPNPVRVFGHDADGHHAIDGCLWPAMPCSGHVLAEYGIWAETE